MNSMENTIISDTLRNPENAALPKTVRTLPNLVRFQNQGNALSFGSDLPRHDEEKCKRFGYGVLG